MGGDVSVCSGTVATWVENTPVDAAVLGGVEVGVATGGSVASGTLVVDVGVAGVKVAVNTGGTGVKVGVDVGGNGVEVPVGAAVGVAVSAGGASPGATTIWPSSVLAGMGTPRGAPNCTLVKWMGLVPPALPRQVMVARTPSPLTGSLGFIWQRA